MSKGLSGAKVSFVMRFLSVFNVRFLCAPKLFVNIQVYGSHDYKLVVIVIGFMGFNSVHNALN